jgi:hypothetical protein
MSIPEGSFFHRMLCSAFLLLLSAGAHADPLAGIAEEDFPALEALSAYPADLRQSLLEASTEAYVLSELGKLQERSRTSFRELLTPYDQAAQEPLFELTRYPALVEEIVDGGPKEVRELEVIAGHYPEDVRAAAVSAGRDHWKVVARIHALLASQQTAFDSVIGELPGRKQEAFRDLLSAPEVLALLGEHTEMAVLLGDAYEREPEAVLAALEALQHEVAERNAAEARDFVAGVADDPELEREVEASYQAYEEETTQDVNVNVNVNVNVVRPYSYWVGVPWWVPTTYVYYDPWVYWYPRPYWRHCGSHFGPRFTVVHHAPHFGFYGWYFSHPWHHHRYPRLSNHILGHHERHGYGSHGRRSGYHGGRDRHFGMGRHAVDRFVRDTEGSMPRGFLRAGKDRPERLAEYGRLQSELDRSARKPGKNGKPHRPGKHRREDFEREVAKRPGDFPGLTKLTRDEKPGGRSVPAKRPKHGRADPRWNEDAPRNGKTDAANKEKTGKIHGRLTRMPGKGKADDAWRTTKPKAAPPSTAKPKAAPPSTAKPKAAPPSAAKPKAAPPSAAKPQRQEKKEARKEQREVKKENRQERRETRKEDRRERRQEKQQESRAEKKEANQESDAGTGGEGRGPGKRGGPGGRSGEPGKR